MITDLNNGSIGVADLDSDEESQHDSSEEDNAKEDDVIRDNYSRDVKRRVDFCMQQ